jgi:hypothetical protein
MKLRLFATLLALSACGAPPPAASPPSAAPRASTTSRRQPKPQEATQDCPKDGKAPGGLVCHWRGPVVAPIVVGPGRVRILFDSPPPWLPDAPDPNSESEFLIVETTPAGERLVALGRCPGESTPLSAFLWPDGALHLICGRLIRNKAVEPGFSGGFYHELYHARINDAGEVNLASPKPIVIRDELMVDSLLLAPQAEGPPLLFYTVWSEGPSGMPEGGEQKALLWKEGAAPRSLRLSGDLSNGNAKLETFYSQDGRLYALLAAYPEPKNPSGYHRIEIAPTGLKDFGPLRLTPYKPSRCEADRQSVYSFREKTLSLAITYRDYDRDEERVGLAALAGASPLPGPRVATQEAAPCYDASALSPEPIGRSHPSMDIDAAARVSCGADGCVAVYGLGDALWIVHLAAAR